MLIKTLVKDCGYGVPTAVKMLTEVPAKILKLNIRCFYFFKNLLQIISIYVIMQLLSTAK